jgi:hypothetical protein
MGSVGPFIDHHTATTMTLHTTLLKWISLLLKAYLLKLCGLFVKFFDSKPKIKFIPSEKEKAPK